MSIDTIPGVKFIQPTDRCYEFALDFTIASCSLGEYFNAYLKKPVTSYAPRVMSGRPMYPTIGFAGHASGSDLALVPHDVLTRVFVDDLRDKPVAYLSSRSKRQPSDGPTGAVSDTLEGLAQAMFTRYYEQNLATIQTAYGRRSENRWPPVIQFSAVIRDAMSHGGIIHMFPHVPAVTHFGLTYSSKDNGRKVIHNDLSCADIFFLMLEMDAAF